MCSIPSLGALKKDTKEYVYPAAANKLDKYICPDCNKDLVLKKGSVRIHHFAHFKEDNPCNYYNRPSESQIHKDAKMLLKSLLDKKTKISLIRKCPDITCIKWNQDYEEYEIPEITDTSKIIIEHRFNYNGLKIADVAYIDNGEIVCIFEICNTHKTEEINRPEPWFEIDAIKFINSVNNNNTIQIECIRKTCEYCALVLCLRCKELLPRWMLNMNPMDNRICKSCYINEGDWLKIYLNVPFSDKELIKSYKGRFDSLYKKWYINEDNKYKNTVLSKWKIWKP